MDETEFAKLLAQAAKENDADLYLFSGPVAIKAERTFNQTLSRHKKRKNAFCLTTTYGGSADVAYQMVRAVRRHYPDGEFIKRWHVDCTWSRQYCHVGHGGVGGS